MAKAQLKEKQKDLREFIEQTNAEEGTEVLRRDSGRDKDAHRYVAEPQLLAAFHHSPCRRRARRGFVAEPLPRSLKRNGHRPQGR